MNRRKIDRFTCYAKVVIKNDGNPGYIRDINGTGCQIDVIGSCPYQTGQILSLMIIPEESLNIPPFEAELEMKWKEEEAHSTKIGGEIKVLDKHTNHLAELVDLFYIQDTEE